MKIKKSKLTSALIKCTAAIVLGGIAGGAFADSPTFGVTTNQPDTFALGYTRAGPDDRTHGLLLNNNTKLACSSGDNFAFLALKHGDKTTETGTCLIQNVSMPIQDCNSLNGKTFNLTATYSVYDKKTTCTITENAPPASEWIKPFPASPSMGYTMAFTKNPSLDITGYNVVINLINTADIPQAPKICSTPNAPLCIISIGGQNAQINYKSPDTGKTLAVNAVAKGWDGLDFDIEQTPGQSGSATLQQIHDNISAAAASLHGLTPKRYVSFAPQWNGGDIVIPATGGTPALNTWIESGEPDFIEFDWVFVQAYNGMTSDTPKPGYNGTEQSPNIIPTVFNELSPGLEGKITKITVGIPVNTTGTGSSSDWNIFNVWNGEGNPPACPPQYDTAIKIIKQVETLMSKPNWGGIGIWSIEHDSSPTPPGWCPSKGAPNAHPPIPGFYGANVGANIMLCEDNKCPRPKAPSTDIYFINKSKKILTPNASCNNIQIPYTGAKTKIPSSKSFTCKDNSGTVFATFTLAGSTWSDTQTNLNKTLGISLTQDYTTGYTYTLKDIIPAGTCTPLSDTDWPSSPPFAYDEAEDLCTGQGAKYAKIFFDAADTTCAKNPIASPVAATAYNYKCPKPVKPKPGCVVFTKGSDCNTLGCTDPKKNQVYTDADCETPVIGIDNKPVICGEKLPTAPQQGNYCQQPPKDSAS